MTSMGLRCIGICKSAPLTSKWWPKHLRSSHHAARPFHSRGDAAAAAGGQPQNDKPILVSIEGNIGAGKTTLLSGLRTACPEWIFIEEPVGLWGTFRDEQGRSLLELFYADRRRWSYTFQNCALLTRFQNIEAAIANAPPLTDGTQRVFVSERCLDTDYQVFTKMLHREGSMDAMEFGLYERWFQELQASATPLDGVVWLRTPPDECAARINSRGRKGEDGITLSYLRALEAQQRQWLSNGDIPCAMVQDTGDVGVQEVRRFVESMQAGELL